MISLHEGRGPGPSKQPVRALQLHLKVAGCRPAIWRRFLVKDSMWLSRLHDAIQLAFDWFDYQTHAFTIASQRYGNPLKRDDFVIHDDRDLRLSDLEIDKLDRFTYGYHFGQGWQVDIQIEETQQTIKGQQYPWCLGGERAGPPEDCGGLDAYHDMLACIQEPHTELGREWLDWLGPEYDPERCDVAAINKAFRKITK